MKKLLTILAFLMAILTGKAQNVQMDAQGNYHAIKRNADTTAGQRTGKTYTDTKNVVYEVYLSKNGKPYVNRVSAKTGRAYKQYLKLQQ